MSLLATVASNAVNSFIVPPSFLGDLSVANGVIPFSIATGATISNDVFQLAISPDGLFVYSTDGTIYSRNTSSGILAQTNTFTGLNWDVIISPNGKFVYANDGSSTIYQYSRDTSTGVLTALSTPSVAVGQSESWFMTMSPDGTSLYIANDGTNNISHFTANTSTGLLTSTSTVTVSNSPEFHLVISPDGTSAYIGTGNGNIQQYTRNTSTGVLATNGTASAGAGNPTLIAISSDGLFAYSSQAGTTAVYVYSRNTSTGVLTYLNSQTVPTLGANVGAITVTPDNNYLYLNGNGAISQYSRNTSTGAFSLLGTPNSFCQSTGSTLYLTADGKGVYYISSAANSIYGMSRNTSNGTMSPINTAGVVGYTNYGVSGSFSNAVITSDGQFVYLVNNSAVITALSRNTTDGSIAQVNTTTTTGSSQPSLIDIAISPDGLSIYVVDEDNSLVYMYSRDTSTGVLTPLSTPTVATGNSSIHYTSIIEVSPDGLSAYVANSGDNTLSQYSRNTSTGILTAMGTPTLTVGNTPMGVAISPDGTTVYVANETDSTISQFTRNTSTGALTAMGTPTISVGVFPGDIIISSDGKFAYAANLNADSISLLTRNTSTGALSLMTVPGPVGVATGTTPFEVTLSSDGKFAYVVNNAAATISQYSRNTSTGALTALGTPTVATGTSPRFMSISPDGASAYVANQSSGTVSQYNRDTSTGLLTAMSTPTVTVASATYAVIVSADGAYAYAINRAAAASAKVYQFSRNTSTGALTPLATPTINAGNQPASICVSSDNNSLYVLNASANTVQSYSRNTSTGLLTSLGTVASSTGGVGVIISPDGTSVYVANSSGLTSQVTGFTRNTSTGVLTANTNEKIYPSAAGLVMSADGLFVYVCHSTMNCVSLLRRNPSNGVLTFVTTFPILGQTATGIGISPDGLSVYVTNSTTNMVYQFSRNTSNGALTGSSTVPLTWVNPLTSGIGVLKITPDGKTMYTQGAGNGNIYSLNRNTSNGLLSSTKVAIYTNSAYGPNGMICSPDNQQLLIFGGSSVNALQRALK